eukprot:5463329-Prymnesium_polylepis.1
MACGCGEGADGCALGGEMWIAVTGEKTLQSPLRSGARPRLRVRPPLRGHNSNAQHVERRR